MRTTVLLIIYYFNKTLSFTARRKPHKGVFLQPHSVNIISSLPESYDIILNTILQRERIYGETEKKRQKDNISTDNQIF